MNFKSLLERDLKTVFLNCGEFAQITEFWYDGNRFQIPAILESFGAEERARRTLSDHADGLQSVSLVLHAALEDLKTLPKQGRILTLDGVYYTIAAVHVDAGAVALELERTAE